jgi:hypothetical protein
LSLGLPLLLKEIRARELWPALQERLKWEECQHSHLKALPASDANLPALLRLADNLAPTLKRRFLAAVAKIQNAMDLEKLAAAIEANSLTAAQAAAQLSALGEKYGELAIDIKAAFLAGSTYTLSQLASRSALTSSFEIVNPHAVEYAAKITSKIVQPWLDGAKELIADEINKAVSGLQTPMDAARSIRDKIGLDPPRVARVNAKWEALLEQGVPEADIDRRIGKFMQQLLTERAETIALTETHRAAVRGQQAGWEAAIEDGVLDKDKWVKVWSITKDERLCDICEPMDGKEAEIDEPYKDDDGNDILNVFGEPMLEPDMHPRCRCISVLTKKEDVTQAHNDHVDVDVDEAVRQVTAGEIDEDDFMRRVRAGEFDSEDLLRLIQAGDLSGALATQVEEYLR